MTREEELKQASIKHTKSNRPVCIGGDRFSAMIDALNVNKDFIAGANYADLHPKSPWISVEDALPEMYEDVVVLNNGKPIMSRRYKVMRSNAPDWKLHESWQWSRCLVNVTHWMPIPKLPKDNEV